MGLPVTLAVNGVVTGAPANPFSAANSLQEVINLSTQQTYQASKSARPTVNAPNPLLPFVLGLDTITKVRFIAFRVRGGSLLLLLTSAAGVDQAQRVSDEFVWSGPNAGDEVTAIKFVGIADLEIFIAGDVT